MIVFISFLFLSIWAGSSVRLAQHPLGLRARLTGVLASFRLLVALRSVRDLLLSAKPLFGAAIADGDAARLQQSSAQMRSQETVAEKK
jgi:hypothetical protein